MNNKRWYLIALLAVALPILFRGAYYYRGFYDGKKIKAPQYESYQVPLPPTASINADVDRALGKDKVVVIDFYHKNMFDPSEIESFTALLHERGARVEMYDGSQILSTQLKYAASFIVFSPTMAFSFTETNAIHSFVASGGRLIAFSDPTRSSSYFDYTGTLYVFPDVNYANPILSRYDLTIENDYLYNLLTNEGNFRNVMFTDFADHAVVRGLNMIVMYGSHSIKTGTGMPLAVGTDEVLSSLTDQGGSLAPAGLSSNGQVMALGDFTFLLDPYNQVADNAAFAAQIADFALSAERVASLETYPYIFKGSEARIVLAGDAQLNAEMTLPLASMQNWLKNLGISTTIKEDTSNAGNVIILGVVTTPEEFDTYLRPFQISTDPSAGYIEVPGFGKVGKYGNGLILFNPGTSGNQLMLMASTPADLIALINRAVSGDLSTCAIQGYIAVCSIGYGGLFYDGATPTPYLDWTLTPTPTPYKP